ncbi:MAG: sulfate adenylyltransferase subunit 2 [Armatimonadetes bacterium]|nr:sulfate adenylyltransferase subunit 2 [Armatimonadota bacterium]MBS1727339.1 sulfate adenylyltransferase subunit 2 [Armatimonadota bacterium]
MTQVRQPLDAGLRALESEAIYVIREVFGQFERPILLFSGGKDSIVLAHLAARAFAPARVPFKLVHVDTGHNFEETLAFRDRFAESLGCDLVVKQVQELIDAGRLVEEPGPHPSRNGLQTQTLLEAIADLKADAAMGGARRDEEKARAKERFFSFRDRFGQWDPKAQRPELWSLFNGRKHPGEHFRVFPLSNWTELDIWRYIAAREIEMPSLYFSHRRRVILRQGVLYADTPYTAALPGETVLEKEVRFRTIGDATCTGAIESRARTIEEVIVELGLTRVTERNTRGDDKRSEAAMEDRKRLGYF